MVGVDALGRLHAIPADKFWTMPAAPASESAFALQEQPPSIDTSLFANFVVVGFESGLFVWRVNGG